MPDTDTVSPVYDSASMVTVHRAALKAACMREIFNSDGSVSDVRRSVLVAVDVAGGKRVTALFSAPSFALLPDLARTAAALPPGSVIEVWDGRHLSSRGKAAGAGYYRYES